MVPGYRIHPELFMAVPHVSHWRRGVKIVSVYDVVSSARSDRVLPDY